jgi:uncharacterized cysteine cluster protein YcgN (CxxCxxCC family)
MGKKDLCERCGECCRFKEPYEHFWLAEDRYCPHFEWLPDGKGNCRIYSHHVRYKIDDETLCIPAVDLAKAGLLPESCPYAKAIRGYRSRVVNYGESADIAEARIPDRFRGRSRPSEMANDRSQDGLLRLQPGPPDPLYGETRDSVHQHAAGQPGYGPVEETS